MTATSAPADSPLPARILRIRDVLPIVGVCRTTIWEWVRTGHFPPPIRLGARAVGWRADAIAEWIDSRPVADHAASA